VVNLGTISAETAGRFVQINGQNFVNQGTLEAKNGSTLTIGTSQSSLGNVSVTGSTLNLNGNWAAQQIDANSSTLNLGGTFTPAALGAFERTGGTVNLTGTVSNAGTTL